MAETAAFDTAALTWTRTPPVLRDPRARPMTSHSLCGWKGFTTMSVAPSASRRSRSAANAVNSMTGISRVQGSARNNCNTVSPLKSGSLISRRIASGRCVRAASTPSRPALASTTFPMPWVTRTRLVMVRISRSSSINKILGCAISSGIRLNKNLSICSSFGPKCKRGALPGINNSCDCNGKNFLPVRKRAFQLAAGNLLRSTELGGRGTRFGHFQGCSLSQRLNRNSQ